MDFSTLAFYNPWWKSATEEEHSVQVFLRSFREKKFQRDYTSYFDLSGNALYIVRGPRQIGKSTLLQATVVSQLRKALRRSVLYLPLDTVTSFTELRTLLLQFYQFAQHEQKRYLFLDEISMVDQWHRAIKEVRDNTPLKDDIFILTGSSAWDLKRYSERLPGRKGDADSDVLLLPMTFREYLEAKEETIPQRKEIEEILECTEKDAFEWIIVQQAINIQFAQYKDSGGIPSVIECTLTGEGRNRLVNTFWDVIIGDIERIGLSRAKLIQILTFIAERLSSRLSWNSAASEVEMDTKTFQKYIEALGMNYILLTLKAIDQNTGFPAEKKQKKLYFSDPFFLEVIHEKLGTAIHENAWLENLFVTNCAFTFGKNLEEGLDKVSDVGYWYSKEGREIDLLIRGIPIELKLQNNINRNDIYPMVKHFHRGILVSKHTLDLSGAVKIIPLPLFLAMV